MSEIILQNKMGSDSGLTPLGFCFGGTQVHVLFDLSTHAYTTVLVCLYPGFTFEHFLV